MPSGPSEPPAPARPARPTLALQRRKEPSAMRFGPFEVERVLGSGAMATVYAASHPARGQVALKVAMQPEHGAWLEREHALLHRFDHPGIPNAHGFLEVAGRPTLCMSLLSGEHYAKHQKFRSPRKTVSLMISLLAVLDHVHRRGVVHCDVKRQNVLIGDRAQLLDFGIAREIGASAANSAGQVAGTLAYMAPEVLKGREVHPATDLYSLGVLLYHSLTDRFPFPIDHGLNLSSKEDRVWIPPTAIRPELPAAVDHFLYELFAPHPADRPSSEVVRARLRALMPIMTDRVSCSFGVVKLEPATTREMSGTG